MEQERISANAIMPPWVRHQHVARYRFAATFVAEKRVIDGACGSGYGSALLADAGARCVKGLDIASDGLREALRAHARTNLTFRTCDLAALDVPPGSCDIFVSFETIEHIDDENAFLAGVRRALASDGIFMVRHPIVA